MEQTNKRQSVTLQELLVATLAQTDVLSKLLIEKGSTHEKSTWRSFPLNVRRIRNYSTRLYNSYKKHRN
jgi:hypothetical protein